jgi:ribosomal protein S18 acetylase RimI-like enzyme
MPKTIADLYLRPRFATDDLFLEQLSLRLFSPYTAHPDRATLAMVDERDAVTMVAELGGAPVGFFVVALQRHARAYGPWQKPSLGRLNAIGVVPEHHGRGVGRFLLDEAEATARDKGAVSMTLMTADSNARARRLFVSAGYQQLYMLQRAYLRGQRGLVMTKAL